MSCCWFKSLDLVCVLYLCDASMSRECDSNGNVHEKEVNLFKKRRWSLYSDNEENNSFYGAHMTGERYQSMLGKHIQKYKRRFKGTLSSLAQNQAATPLVKSNTGLKAPKSGNEHMGGEKVT